MNIDGRTLCEREARRERAQSRRSVRPSQSHGWLSKRRINGLICAHGGDIGRNPGEIALFSPVALTADDFAATTALAVEDWISRLSTCGRH